MEIKHTALIGAGAVGGYFIYGLTDLEGTDFFLIAEGERKERLLRDGVWINGKQYRPCVLDPAEASERGVDLLLIATKYSGLFSVLPAIQKATGPDTIVMSLMNGIDSEEIIGSVIDPSHIVYSLMRIVSTRKDGNIVFDPDRTPGVFYGEKGSSEPSERILAIRDLLACAGLHGHIMEDILTDQWDKYALNICYNLPQAVLATPFRSYFDSEHVAFIRDALYREVSAVAQANGIHLHPLSNTKDSWPPTVRFSTLQDLDAGRRTEIDMFTGVLMKKAKEAGIPVPFAEYTYHAIKALEEKNEGKFNY